MQKFTLAALASFVLAGCASAPEPDVSAYSYESKAHSGTVHVTDKHYSAKTKECGANWRDGEIYTPKGILPQGRDHLFVGIDVDVDGQGTQHFDIGAPFYLEKRVIAKDYQTTKSWMLGAETHGLMQQGEHFSYPEGYFVRVSQPAVVGHSLTACIGIDHMYVLDADLKSSTNPPVYLDRVVVPFSMEQGDQPVRVTFGDKLNHSVEIRVLP